MPDRTISILGAFSGLLLAAYVGLVITTITFAAWQTDLRADVRASEAAIAALERDYYGAVARVNATSPDAFGLVTPSAVRYAAMATVPALSLR